MSVSPFWAEINAHVEIIRANSEFRNESKVKDSILQLAEKIAEGVKEQRIDVINKMKRVLQTEQQPTLESISAFLTRYLEEEKIHRVSDRYIREILPDDYKKSSMKRDIAEKKSLLVVEDIPDEELIKHKDEIESRIRSLAPQKPKDYVGKTTVEEPEKFVKVTKWSHPLVEELARITSQINDDILNKQYDSKVLDELFEELKSIRDRRFMTPISKLKAIAVVSECVVSLNHAVEGENYIQDRWGVHDNERDCKECRSLVQCRKENCTHICHQFIKTATTKGAKFAFNSDDKVKELRETVKELVNYTPKDLCVVMKQILDNPRVQGLEASHKIKLMDSHIKKTECQVCSSFIAKYPKFFEDSERK